MVENRIVLNEMDSMDILQLMKERHSVRQYLDKEIPEEFVVQLQQEVERCNAEGNLQMQLITGDAATFEGIIPHYGKFRGVSNYIALVGRKESSLHYRIGYYGEHLVLFAQKLGLNTCWVASTYNRRKCKAIVQSSDQMPCILALGYGETPGHTRRTKAESELAEQIEPVPDWYRLGVEAALLAPTAVNQQKYYIYRDGEDAFVYKTGGVFSKVDLGIVKYHFEAVSGHELQIISHKKVN